MRRGLLRAVSSALLLGSSVFMPHPHCSSGCIKEYAGGSSSIEAVISEFYPCALVGDEYFAISCAGDVYYCMRNWSVTDGEGEIKIIADLWLFPGRPFTISYNASSFWRAYGVLPDVALDSPSVGSLVGVSGSLRLADSGDTLVLRGPSGELLDEVAYGSSNDVLAEWLGAAIPCLRKGEVAKRLELNGHMIDSNTAADWEPFREFKYGYTEFGPQRFEILPGAITAFSSPDCSLEVVVNAIEGSQKAFCICSYELSSDFVCRAVLRAIDRGVNVRILIDGAPAGNLQPDEIVCLSALSIAGADVKSVNGNLSRGIVQHVGALHSKYLVADASISIIMSENFVEAGLPQDRLVGNRGWGVMIEDRNVARYLLEIFDSDSRASRADVFDWRSDARFNSTSSLAQPAAMADDDRMLIGPYVSTQRASLTIVPSPDGSIQHPYLQDVLQARVLIVVEQFQVDLNWISRWTGVHYLNPLIQTLISSAMNGSEERILLDSSWLNIERNHQVIQCLDENTSGTLGRFALLDSRSPITLLHNKGAILENKISVISSNNWVSASFSKNRELGVLIDSEEIASHFVRAFDVDWVTDETPPVCDAGPDIELSLGSSAVLDAGNCSDDRIINEYSWDFEADGVIDSCESKALFKAIVPGEHVVVLKVTDAWGNSATDELRVRVISPSPYDDRGVSPAVPRFLWLVPMSVSLGVLTFMMVTKKKRDITHNFNHRPRS